MSQKKTSSAPNSRLNFRGGRRSDVSERAEASGTKPLPGPTSVFDVFFLMVSHVCRKILFFELKYRIFAYLGGLFLVSLLADVLPFPKTYFARKDNMFNVYFVKLAWGWTLSVGALFVLLTSFTYCCGDRDKILKHLSRLVVSTVIWFVWTNFFVYLDSWLGRCNVKEDLRIRSKHACLVKGFVWTSLDISGHCFLLIYSNLVLIEEARSIISWERISDMIREEHYSRNIEVQSNTLNPLRGLNDTEFRILQDAYVKLSPYIRSLFILITLFVLLWDFMLLNTILYFHNMLEKLLGGLWAIAMWWLTYQVWYPNPSLLPPQPGEGKFKYGYRQALVCSNSVQGLPRRILTRSAAKNSVPGPRFMGMPLRVSQEVKNEESGA